MDEQIFVKTRRCYIAVCRPIHIDKGRVVGWPQVLLDIVRCSSIHFARKDFAFHTKYLFFRRMQMHNMKSGNLGKA